jgi:zinc D-Ala-D-Ala dipeptidase
MFNDAKPIPEASLLEGFKKAPILDLDQVREKKKGYREYPLEPIEEEFDDARKYGIHGENYYNIADNPPYNEVVPGSIPELILRKSIIEKLVEINKSLAKIGFELYLFDGFRHIGVQNYMHDVWCPKYLKGLHPDWNQEKVLSEVSNYWAYGGADSDEKIDPKSPPPHSTGGAVDLTLRNIKTGELLSMGSGFDDPTELSHTDYFENHSEDQEARDNRRLLYWIMQRAGFANNPTEWWHFCYGDQMWAKLTDQEKAIYSNIVPK